MSSTALFAAIAIAAVQLFIAGLEYQNVKAQRLTHPAIVAADQGAGGQ